MIDTVPSARPLDQGVILGPQFRDISFTVHCDGFSLGAADFDLVRQTSANGSLTFFGETQGVRIFWRFLPERGGHRVTLTVESDRSFTCRKLDSLVFTYAPGEKMDDWRIATRGSSVDSIGLIHPAQLEERLGANSWQGVPGSAKYAEGSLLRGVFPNSHEPGLFLGTILPQNHIHLYRVERDGDYALDYWVTTHFMNQETGCCPKRYESEATWVCTALPFAEAMNTFSEHLPPLPETRPATGWNSWDYYFSALKLEDIIENADAIRNDPRLAAHLKYLVVDMGWEHAWGEWQPNYRFPGGLERLAAEIQARGFTPGIWTAPLVVHPLSYPGLRDPDLFVNNEYGDPWPSPEGGQYAVDPTHPAGQAFLREVFTRLYCCGFRLFKIDFVSAIVSAPRFHDSGKGPYGALADFFRLVRECVGPESHIIGCSLPAECGPGLCDSRRVGIDIHNQWTHVEWAVDFYQLSWWEHGRIATNDPDFLVVRGLDTSLESETNVLNPNAHNPNPPRWRRGPVFSLDEARTWATFVILAGGNLFLSDRIKLLNPTGMELVRTAVVMEALPARPLDLGDAERGALWFAYGEHEMRLGIINWEDQPVVREIDLTAWEFRSPREVVDAWSGERLPLADATLRVTLRPHASALFTWTPQDLIDNGE
jgi:hypothetical protein